jgi:hypothetical protein
MIVYSKAVISSVVACFNASEAQVHAWQKENGITRHDKALEIPGRL